jgi:hypothetical protein
VLDSIGEHAQSQSLYADGCAGGRFTVCDDARKRRDLTEPSAVGLPLRFDHQRKPP